MRITEGTVALAATHVQTATLDAKRSVTAWQGDSRVQLDEAVRIRMSGASAATTLQDYGRRMMPNADGFAGRSGVRPPGLARSGATPTAFGGIPAGHARRAAPPPATAGTGSTDAAGISGAPELDRQGLLWSLLVKLTGDEAGAARLAKLLGQYARMTGADTQFADTMDALAAAHGVAVERSGATGAAATAQQQAPQPPAESWGYREDVSVSVTEHEAVSFAASSVVQTADGRQIAVAEAFSMARDTVATYERHVREGAAARDPLTFALEGGAPRIATDGTTQSVDTDADGTGETVAALAPGTAYLVRDLNGNGLVDGGAELFGPATNDGYAELAALDQDGNGWVDEGDAAWSQLGLWTGASGAAVTALGTAGVGAISTASVATPYRYGSGGSLAAAGVFLYEDGRSGVTGELLLDA